MMRSTPRRSIKLRRCRCGTAILPGDDYVELVISPDHGDVGNVGWWRDAECRPCAVQYGRWPTFGGAVVQR